MSGLARRSRDEPDAASVFLDTDPPHWVARGLAGVLILLFATALTASIVIRIPEAVSGRFTLVPVAASDSVRTSSAGRLQGELRVPEAGLARLRPGLGVKLLYDAFPYQRYGVRYGTVRWVGLDSAGGIAARGESGAFRALIDLADTAIRVDGEPRALMAGMRGEARVVVGRRSLASYALEPIHQLRESVAELPKR